MLGKSGIRLIIDQKFFFSIFPVDTNGFFNLIIEAELPFQPETIISMRYVVPFRSREIAFRKTEIVDSIQQICFSGTVFSKNSSDPGPKIKRAVQVILELNQCEVLKMKHERKIVWPTCPPKEEQGLPAKSYKPQLVRG
jgi:hypothetical protein